MAKEPTVSLAFDPPGPDFAITEDCVMPTIKVTATLKDFAPAPTAPAVAYEWKATLAWTGAACIHSVGRTFKHPDMTAKGPAANFTVPFTKLCGGDLEITVIARSGTMNVSAKSAKLRVVATNPSVTKLAMTAPVLGAFRKLMRLESALRQFRSPACPLFSADGLGGVGLCQLTSPAGQPPPTDEQVWSWKANVAGGAALYNEKQAIAKNYPKKIRNGTEFKAQVKAYNDQRLAKNAPAKPGQPPAALLKPLEIELPDYTDEQLERDTVRGFNGYAGGLHEYRVKRDANGLLVVTVDAGGLKGQAEWERLSAQDRTDYYDEIGLAQNRRGDPNYVDDVEAEASF